MPAGTVTVVATSPVKIGQAKSCRAVADDRGPEVAAESLDRAENLGLVVGALERQAISRGTFRSAGELNAKIRAFVDGWKDRCHPFVWTKTARDPQEGEPAEDFSDEPLVSQRNRKDPQRIECEESHGDDTSQEDGDLSTSLCAGGERQNGQGSRYRPVENRDDEVAHPGAEAAPGSPPLGSVVQSRGSVSPSGVARH